MVYEKRREIHRMDLVYRGNANTKVIDVNKVNHQFWNILMLPVNIIFYVKGIPSRQQPYEFNFIKFA